MNRLSLCLALFIASLAWTQAKEKAGISDFFIDYVIVLREEGEDQAAGEFWKLVKISPKKAMLIADWWRSEALEAHEDEVWAIVDRAIEKSPGKPDQKEVNAQVSVLLRAYYLSHLEQIMDMVSKTLERIERTSR